jgi:biotin carboxyl carrier protein
MKRYSITVNGNVYDAVVEEVDARGVVSSAPVAAPAPTAAPAPVAAPKPAASKPAATGSAGATQVTAPMPGTILDVKVNVGDTVSKGQVIMILEAMKMENDIVAPCDGKITSILAKKNDTVNSGDTLATVQ